uniref:Uncharacterized protein n=1 Tax=Bosea sp. NBC_00436 TaxID=2969620 RepID=A0A9E7ZPY7_9HYPH
MEQRRGGDVSRRWHWSTASASKQICGTIKHLRPNSEIAFTQRVATLKNSPAEKINIPDK